MKIVKIVMGLALIMFMFSQAEARNYPNNYKTGHIHGCSTAKGNYRKDNQAYTSNKQYRNGWNAGKRACRRSNALNSYNIGYNHGCASARGNWRKDANAFKIFTNYRRGWRAGNRACRRSNVLNSYNIGYNHGCASARGNWRKDANAFRRFPAYRRGWRAGDRACRRPIRPIIAPVTVIKPIVKEVEIVKVVQNEMIEAAKDFIQAKYIQESSPQPIQLQIQMNKSNEKYGVLEFTISHEDGSPFARENIADTVYLLCLEKTEDGWEVISDLTRSGVPSNEELMMIRGSLPEDFSLDLLPSTWIDLFNMLEKSSTEVNAIRE